jgi:glutamine phosphoribosylpyrophosphate amidotransferase
MRSGDGRYCMVFNGENYNYVEIGDELRRAGVRLRTRSDSEVLLEAYARYGKDVVHRLRGMFAFAIWDCVSRELFCAREEAGRLRACIKRSRLNPHARCGWPTMSVSRTVRGQWQISRGAYADLLI